MKNLPLPIWQLLLCVVLVLVAYTATPLMQAEKGQEFMEQASGNTSAETASTEQVENKFREVNYENERLNRLIEYGDEENREDWEQQKNELQPYRNQLLPDEE